jgi:hypothetical protein
MTARSTGPLARVRWPRPVNASVILLEDHRQKRLFPTTIGGGATTVELAHQVVERRRQSKSLKLAGLASDWADRSCLVAVFTNRVYQPY